MHVKDALKHAPAGVKTKGPEKKILARGAITITRLETEKFFVAGIAEARPCTVDWRRRR
jgi:hypothetical protein